MTYYIQPQGTPSHKTTLAAKVDTGPSILPGHTIQWRQDGAVIKSGGTGIAANLFLNSGTFDATDTGTIIDFVIDGADTSLPVILSNQRPTVSASVVTDAYNRTLGRPTINWAYSDADGDPQFFYRVRFGSAIGLGDFYDSGKVLSSVQTLTYPNSQPVIPAGATYYWSVEVGDGEKANPTDPDTPEPVRFGATANGSAVVNTIPVVTNVQVNGVSGGATLIGSLAPTISWTYSDIDGQPQQAYRVMVSIDPAFLTGILWDTGLAQGSGANVVYDFNGTGTALPSHVSVYVQVKVKDTLEESAYASTSFVVSNKPVITELTVDNITNPLNVKNQYPWFNWAYRDLDGDPLEAYEIRVSNTNEDLGTDAFVGSIWQPGKTVTPQSYKVQLGEDAFPGCMLPAELLPGIRYYFQVKVYDDYEESDWAVGFFQFNNPPTATNLVIIPANPFFFVLNNDDLRATYDFVDDVGDVESDKTQIKWLRKRTTDASFVSIPSLANGKIVSNEETRPGDQWKFSVRPNDGAEYGPEAFSSPVTVLNLAPTASSLAIVPPSPTTRDDLQALFALSDPDAKSSTKLVATIRWYKNGTEQQALKNAATIPSSVTSYGDEWYFTVVPNDGYDNGPLAISAKATIRNTPPRINSFSVDGQILPKGVRNGTPTFGWSYFDEDAQAQQKYHFILGTRPIRTSVAASTGGGSVSNMTVQFGGDDGIVASARNGTIKAGNEIFDSGAVASSQPSFKYVTEDSLKNFSATASTFASLTNYVLAPDLQSIAIRSGATDGTATMSFGGASGVYDIEFLYSKEEGKSAAYKLMVDGVAVGQFSSVPGTGSSTYVFSTVKVDQGSSVSVAGSAVSAGAKARFQQLRFDAVTSLLVMGQDFTTLSGYVKDGSGGIKLAGLAGTASMNFPYPSGTYDVEVVYVTETSGQPTVTLNVNALTVDSWTYQIGAATRSRFKKAITLAKGDVVKFSGTRNGGALARIRQIIFRPTQTTNVGARLAEGLTYYAAVRVFDGVDWSDWYATKFAMAGTAWISVSNAKGWTIEATVQTTQIQQASVADQAAAVLRAL